MIQVAGDNTKYKELLEVTGEVDPKCLGTQGRGRFGNRSGKKEDAPIKFKRETGAPEESAGPVKESKDLKQLMKRSRMHNVLKKDLESDEEEEGEYSESEQEEEDYSDGEDEESYRARKQANKRQKLNEAGKQKLKRNSEKEPEAQAIAQREESSNQGPKVYESGDEDVYESVAQIQGPKLSNPD